MPGHDDELRLALDALDARQVPAAAPDWQERLVADLRRDQRRRSQLRLRRLLAAAAVAAALLLFFVSGAAARIGVPNPIDLLLGRGQGAVERHHNPQPQPLGGTTPRAAATRRLVVAAVTGIDANGVAVVDARGAVHQLVAPHGGPIRSLAWSPDDTHLAYLQARSATGGSAELWVYDALARRASRADLHTAGATGVQGFTWRGSQELVVAMAARGHGVEGGLWRFDPANGRCVPLRDAAGRALHGVSPSSSDSGATLAFVGRRLVAPATIAERLLVRRADGVVSQLAAATRNEDPDVTAFGYPLLSPDGALIATMGIGEDPGFRCTVFRRDGSKALTTAGLFWPSSPSWSSDDRLAFAGIRTSDWQHHTIQVWRPGTSRPTAVLSPIGRRIGTLAWSPKATQIAYSVVRRDGSNESLWVVDADGADRHPLLAHGSWPAWAVTPLDTTALPPLTAAVVTPKPTPTAAARASATPTPSGQPRPSPLPSSWTNGGSATQRPWNVEPSGTGADLSGIDLVGARDGWAVGAGGTVLVTHDGGGTWRPQTASFQGWLSAVAFADPTHGWAVGVDGTVLATAEGGDTWSTQVAGGSGSFAAVAATDTTHAWAAGGSEGAQGRVMATTDGTTWIAQDIGSCDRLLGLAFQDARHGWAVGLGGTIIATSDGGQTWSRQRPPRLVDATFTAVRFVDDEVGWVAGYLGAGLGSRQVLLATSDGGAHWAVRSLGDAGTRFQGIAFLDAHRGWAIASYRRLGAVLVTNDGGATWAVDGCGVRYVSGIDCTPDGRAQAVGDRGVIVGAPSS